MLSNRPIGLHLILDDTSVYNQRYQELQLTLGLRYGSPLLADHKEQLSSDLIDEILAEFATGAMKVNLENEKETIDRVCAYRETLAKALENVHAHEMDEKVDAVHTTFAREFEMGLVGLPDRLPLELQTALFVNANAGLLNNLRHELHRGAAVFVANASARQYSRTNKLRAKLFDTGCLFKDMQALVSGLQEERPEYANAAWLSPLTMSDVGFKWKAGDHFKHVISHCSQNDFHPEMISGIAAIYLHAHHIATQHPDADIAVHCYDSNAEYIQFMRQMLIDYPTLMPPGSHVLFHDYNGEILSTKTALGFAPAIDGAYRDSTLALNKALHQRKVLDIFPPLQKLPMKLFISDRDKNMLPNDDKHIGILLDADNCIYNIFYFNLLNCVVDRFGDRILALRNEATESEEVKLLAEEIMSLIRNIPDREILTRKINYKTLKAKWNELMERFGKIVLDKDISLMHKSQPPQSKEHGPMMAQFIRLIDRVAPNAMVNIILRANKNLVMDVEGWLGHFQANCAVMVIASLRQNAYNDFFNSVWNGTGLIFNDLEKMVEALNEKYRNTEFKFKFDPLTLVDCLYKLSPGSHHRYREDEGHKSLLALNDIEKIRIMYAMMHHLARVYDVFDAIFYDDNLEVLTGIMNAYHADDKHGLLPSYRKLHMIQYDGTYPEKGLVREIDGSGKIDMHPHYFLESTIVANADPLNSEKLAEFAANRMQVIPRHMHNFAKLLGWRKKAAAPIAESVENEITANIANNLN